MNHIINHSGMNKQQVGEIVRFGIVGTIATLIQYGIYWLLLLFGENVDFNAMSHTWPTVSMTIAYIVSFIFNFIASTYFTFKVKANVKRGAGFAFSHVINYLLQMLTLNFFLWIGLSKQIAPIPMFCVCVPVNFVLVRFFLKR